MIEYDQAKLNRSFEPLDHSRINIDCRVEWMSMLYPVQHPDPIKRKPKTRMMVSSVSLVLDIGPAQRCAKSRLSTTLVETTLT